MSSAPRFSSLSLLRPATSISEVLALVADSRAGVELLLRVRASHLNAEILAIPASLREAFSKGGYTGVLPAACVRSRSSDSIRILYDDQAPLLLAAAQVVHELTHALEVEGKAELDGEWEAHAAHLRFVQEQFRKNSDVRAVLDRKFTGASHLWTPLSRGELVSRYGGRIA